MTADQLEGEDFVALYQRAFSDYGTHALWNRRCIAEPTRDDALVVARALRTHGNLDARRLAERLERACSAPV
jgi:hypothetical protein